MRLKTVRRLVQKPGFAAMTILTLAIEIPIFIPTMCVMEEVSFRGLLDSHLHSSEDGRGWQTEHEGIVVGLHERGSGPGDRFSLPYFPVADLAAVAERVRALGGEIVHPGERWVICRDSEGTPFALAGRP